MNRFGAGAAARRTVAGRARFGLWGRGVAAVGIGLSLALGGWAQERSVSFEQPAAGVPLFGVQEVRLAVEPVAGLERVTVALDGVVVATGRRPPFHFSVDFGQDNEGHRLEAVAYWAEGAESAELAVPAIRVDDRVDLELTELYLTVTRDGIPVEGLSRGDFTVYDDGQRQQVVTFARGDVPLTAVLAVDGSESMRGDRLARATAGARAFVEALAPRDQARITVFADRVIHESPFSGFREVLATGLNQLRAGGGSSINDHLYRALRQLEERRGRRVVVLLSDGTDTTSVLAMKELAGTARRSPALVYWIQLGSLTAVSSAWRDTAGHAAEVSALVDLVDASGGRVVPLPTLDEAQEAFGSILEELREQYVLGFYPSVDRDDGRWHRIRVRVDQPGLTVRTRAGYLDE